jgi:hypothetical protein
MQFWLLTIIYIVVTATVIRWTLISALGFWMCTPEYFVKFPTVYKLLPLILLTLSAIVGFSSGIPWYVVIIALLMARTASLWIGKKLAFAKFRKEVINNSDTDPEELVTVARRTDEELMKLAKLLMKH